MARKNRVVKEFFEYLGQNKKLWLIPIFIILGLAGLAILVSQGIALGTALYV